MCQVLSEIIDEWLFGSVQFSGLFANADVQLHRNEIIQADCQEPAQKRLPTNGIPLEARFPILISSCPLHLALFPSVCDLRRNDLFRCLFLMT